MQLSLTVPYSFAHRPVFAFTSQYVVNVDDFFLHYIQKEQVPVEFHQAVGTEYKTIATGKLRMNDLLEKSHGRIHGALKLMGMYEKILLKNYTSVFSDASNFFFVIPF